MRKWILVGAVVLGLAVLVVVGAGYALPAEHEASRTAFYPRSAREIWSAVTGWEEFPRWRSGVSRVRPIEGARGWIEIGPSGELPLAIVESRAPRHLVVEVTGGQAFSGTWTYEIVAVADGSGCNLTITEHGRVQNPVFRFVARVFMDPRATMSTYLTDLGARFGGDAWRFVD